MHSPFVRWDIISHGVNGSTKAGVYYLQTAQGEKVVCATGIPGEGNHMTYRPLDSFLDEYHAVLPSSHTLEWNFKFQLAAWLDGIVYYSFLQCSKEGARAGSFNSDQMCILFILEPFTVHLPPIFIPSCHCFIGCC